MLLCLHLSLGNLLWLLAICVSKRAALDQAVWSQADVTSRQGHCRVWFPFRIITSLLIRLQRRPSLHEKHSLLQTALQQHQHTAMSMSSAFKSKFDDEVATMEE